MKTLLLGLSFAALGSVATANAAVTVVQIASPGNWTAFDNDPVGQQSGSTTTNSGVITFNTDGGVGNGTTSTHATPAGDTSNYLYGFQSGATVTFAEPVTSFDIYWGSIDGQPGQINVLTLSNGDQITGADLIALGFTSGNGNQFNADTNQWFRISDSTPFTSFTASSNVNAFEFDMAGPTVPEPPTWAMMILGFAGLGYAAFRKASRATATAAIA